jgi:hypothetical protein
MSRGQIHRFLEYFSKQLSFDQMVYLNTINNITPEKVELFRDFSISLTYIIEDTYLGDDVIETQSDQINHFNWCWDQNIKNFNKENIFFQAKGEHYYYYMAYFMDIYYGNSVKTKGLFKKMVGFWDDVLSINNLKTKSEHDLLCEIYKIMDKYFVNNY